jgi:hypothetical protein
MNELNEKLVRTHGDPTHANARENRGKWKQGRGTAEMVGLIASSLHSPKGFRLVRVPLAMNSSHLFLSSYSQLAVTESSDGRDHVEGRNCMRKVCGFCRILIPL